MAKKRTRRKKNSRPWLLPILGVTIIGVAAALWTLLHPGGAVSETAPGGDGFAPVIRDQAARSQIGPRWILEDDPIRKSGGIFLRTWKITVPDPATATRLSADLIAEASSRGLAFEDRGTAAGGIKRLRIDDEIEAFDIRFVLREKNPGTGKNEPATRPYAKPPETPERTNRKTADTRPGKLAILLDDAGQSMELVDEAARLPTQIGFAVIPFLPSSSSAADTLFLAGHEIWLHLPMEPTGYPDENPGPGAVFLAMPEDEIRETVHRAVNAVPHVVGVNNHMGSRATSDLRAMTWVMQEIKGRGLAFIDSRTTVDTVAEEAARAQGVPTGRRHVFLDNDRTPSAIRSQLELALSRVLAGEDIIAIGHFAQVTIEVLGEDGPRLMGRGVTLVPPTEILLEGELR